MIPFLPPPQEMRYTGEQFRPTGQEKLFFSPWKGEDAAERVLHAALKPFGLSRAGVEQKLPKSDGATFALAADIAVARKLVHRAIAGLDKKVPTATICHDGPCFPDETTHARRAARELRPQDSSEEYSLQISPEGIAIAGRSRRAMFWGVQSLCQILEYCRREREKEVPGLLIRDWPTQQVRGLHLDMKYLFQRPEAIEEWLRQIPAWKMNTVLFEYEDKFPYQRHRFLRHEAAMTPAQLRRVLNTARRHHIQVIPLIQTLGHLEYCLKHEELAHLREMPDIQFQINPLNPEASRFVLEMIDEVMEYHPDAEYFHVGGDETWFLGANPQSKEVLARKGEIGIYLDHMIPILEHVMQAGKRPILWDDILREQADKCARIPRETVLGYWDYGPVREQHNDREMSAALRQHYRLEGKRPELWPDTLSAFPFFDFYRQKGFDVLSIPCCNYATLVPDDAHNIPNTIKFAEKAALSGGLGTLNSQWASFKTPFGVMWHSYALTAQSTWLFPPADITDFDSVFSRLVLDEPSGASVRASRLIAEGVGFRVPGAGRMFNLLHFAIMDSELSFDGGLEERRKKGSAVSKLDFERIVQRKLNALRGLATLPDVLARLRWVETQIEAALRLLEYAPPNTAGGKSIQELLVASARFKLTRAGTMRFLLNEKSPFKSARAALRAEQRSRDEMTRVYGASVASADLEFEMRLLFEGEMAALRALANGNS